MSPENKTYRTNDITLSVFSNAEMFVYRLDGRPAGVLVNTTESLSFNLSDGSHTIIVDAWTKGTNSVTFTIDTIPPKVSIVSPENITYESFEVPLNFTVNEEVSQITYSLDGQVNVTIAGNTTLTGLSVGEQNITVYATDIAGHTDVSEAVYFSVKEPEPQPFPTALVIAPTASMAVVGIGLLVYFRKRKH